MKIKAGVIGASGYAGCELVRLLLQHPDVELMAISSHQYTGTYFYDLYPSFYQVCDLKFVENEEVIAQSDVIFASLPAGYSEPLARACFDAGKKFIDLGADFRLDDKDVYQQWYGQAYEDLELHKHQVYGLSEWHADQIKDAQIIGNPGCFPTSIELGLYPAITNQYIDLKTIILDSKSGTTGAGKSLTENTHFPRTNEAFAPYKVGAHRHTPEIEQLLSEFAQEEVKVTFTPHLLPINRGIVSTIYANLKADVSLEDIHATYTKAYANQPFVRVLPLGKIADLKFVKMSNYCDISLHIDAHTNRLIIVSCIDNMVKGAAGQAVQNMNLMFGLDQSTGLLQIAPSF